MTWKRGAFLIITAFSNRASGLPAHAWGEREGWSSGPFGIHREAPGCWRITHLPTGRALNTTCPTLAEAKRRVALVASLCDWWVVTAASAKSVVPEAARLILRDGGR